MCWRELYSRIKICPLNVSWAKQQSITDAPVGRAFIVDFGFHGGLPALIEAFDEEIAYLVVESSAKLGHTAKKISQSLCNSVCLSFLSYSLVPSS